MKMTIDRARILLRMSGFLFEEDDEENPKLKQTINLNDTWSWACADGEYVPDEELSEVANLFLSYGYCGILYWVSEKRNQCKSEFHDINRLIEFVRSEERIRNRTSVKH
jgi:hypothetical protein